MAGRGPLRFRLLTLLGLITAVAAVFGYAKWKHQQRLNEYLQLYADGVALTMGAGKSDWTALLATGKAHVPTPIEAKIFFWQLDGETYRIGTRTMTWNELKQEVASLKERTNKLEPGRILYVAGIKELNDLNERGLVHRRYIPIYNREVPKIEAFASQLDLTGYCGSSKSEEADRESFAPRRDDRVYASKADEVR